MLSEASGFSRLGRHRANIRPSSRPRTAAVPKPEKEGRSLEPGIRLRAPHPRTQAHMHAALFRGVLYRSENDEYVKAASRSFTICLFLRRLPINTVSHTPLPAEGPRARVGPSHTTKALTRARKHSTLQSSGHPERGCGFWPMTEPTERNVRKQGCG